MIGKKLAHYEITEKIGSGGMGEVYRARDTKLGRDVALKVLPEELARDPERRMRFEREARAIAALKHPNIITIYSVEHADGLEYITMELVDGKSLADLIPKGGLALDRFFDFAIPIADAISSAHAQGITHRDLKPTNVMVDGEGHVKVLDFGLAKLLDPSVDQERAKTIVKTTDTAVGQIIGTAAYMSPEQAEGKPVDHRSDIFSLGILFYEMATGERPFRGDSHISTISSILKDTPAHITEIKPMFPRHLGRIVSHCLEKKPDDRLQSAKDIRNELTGLRKEVDSGDLTQSAMSHPHMAVPPFPRKRLPWAIGIGAVVVVAAVVGSLWIRQAVNRNASTEGRTASSAPAGHAGHPGAQTSAGDGDRIMTVVFPFENLGPADEAYFAAGVTEEITSRLAAVSDLGVISRTSATQYDRTGKTMKEIGEDLGVDYVLEGTVRWAKSEAGTGRVRITPQLVRVTDDTHVWSQTFDREIDDIFEVQTDIAKRVIDELGVTLLGSEQAQIAEKPTDNMEAYQAYLQSQELDGRFDLGPSEYDRRKAELLDKATTLDPKFVAAWYRLARHHSDFYRTFERTEERLAKARSAVQGAEAADNDHVNTHLARGYYYYYGFRDYDRALEEFVAASKLLPNDSEVLQSIGYIYRRQGRLDECINNLIAAMALDPQSNMIARNLASSYEAQREFPKAVEAIDRALEIEPDNWDDIMAKTGMLVRWKGDVAAAKRILEGKESTSMISNFAWYQIYNYERRFSLARKEIEQIEDDSMFFTAIKKWLIAYTEVREKGPEAARASLESAAQACEDVLASSPGNAWVRQILSDVYTAMGRDEDAVREAKMAVELTAKDAFSGPRALENLAVVYAWLGRHDEAIDLIERLLSTSYEDAITVPQLRVDPLWDPLREHPRFRQIVGETG